MVTTIQVSSELKAELDSLKKNPKMSYAQLLSELVEKEKKRNEQLLLREYAKKYGEDVRTEVKEWESTEEEWDY